MSLWPHDDARSETLPYSTYGNWSLFSYPFFSSSKIVSSILFTELITHDLALRRRKYGNNKNYINQ